MNNSNKFFKTALSEIVFIPCNFCEINKKDELKLCNKAIIEYSNNN